MPENTQTDTCVWQNSSANATIKILKLENGKLKGVVSYKTPTMPKAITFETIEADDIPQAKQFTYFILHEVSEYS